MNVQGGNIYMQQTQSDKINVSYYYGNVYVYLVFLLYIVGIVYLIGEQGLRLNAYAHVPYVRKLPIYRILMVLYKYIYLYINIHTYI